MQKILLEISDGSTAEFPGTDVCRNGVQKLVLKIAAQSDQHAHRIPVGKALL
jgi:hypothetical protein